MRTAFLAIALAGCATAAPKGDTLVRPAPPPPAPACVARQRSLAPIARMPGVAALASSSTGWALTWSERAGDRETLRFLVVDAHGVPRSPSAEVVDRAARLGAPAITVDGDGYAISWAEDAARFSRKVDAQGRPRGDVDPALATASPAVLDRCALTGNELRCAASEGRVLELPTKAHPVAESIETSGLAVIASDEEGLKLWYLECPTSSR